MAAAEHLHPQLFSDYGRPGTAPVELSPAASRGQDHPGQLPMFMTANEITSQYRPNEPDRLFHGTDVSVSRASGVRFNGGTDPRAGEWTGRDARTDGVINNFAADPRGNYHPQRPTGVDLKGEWAKPETDEQMYARKYQESRNPKPGGGTTTFSSIALEGVKTPVALGHEEGTGRPPFVAGGHHRIAVMRNLNPDQYMPVIHVRSVGEAQGLGS
jgi:hypothetical protein